MCRLLFGYHGVCPEERGGCNEMFFYVLEDLIEYDVMKKLLNSQSKTSVASVRAWAALYGKGEVFDKQHGQTTASELCEALHACGRSDCHRAICDNFDSKSFEQVCFVCLQSVGLERDDYGRVNFDTYGEPYDPEAAGTQAYARGAGVSADQGELVAAFDGRLGWSWRNRSDDTVTLTLRTEGNYRSMPRTD